MSGSFHIGKRSGCREAEEGICGAGEVPKRWSHRWRSSKLIVCSLTTIRRNQERLPMYGHRCGGDHPSPLQLHRLAASSLRRPADLWDKYGVNYSNSPCLVRKAFLSRALLSSPHSYVGISLFFSYASTSQAALLAALSFLLTTNLSDTLFIDILSAPQALTRAASYLAFSTLCDVFSVRLPKLFSPHTLSQRSMSCLRSRALPYPTHLSLLRASLSALQVAAVVAKERMLDSVNCS